MEKIQRLRTMVKVKAVVEFQLTRFDLDVVGRDNEQIVPNMINELVKIKTGLFENMVHGDIISAEIIPTTKSRGKAAGK